MKKVLPGILISVTALFLVFLTGLFIGRQQIKSHNLPDYTVAIESEPTAPTAPKKININTATASELSDLPGIGYGLATDIVAYREANGPFASTHDITLVKGIGVKRYEAIANLICV